MVKFPKFNTTDKSQVNFTLDEFRMIVEGNYDSLAEKILRVGYYKLFVTNGGKFFRSLIEEDQDSFSGLMFEVTVNAVKSIVGKDAKFFERSDGERNCYLGMEIMNRAHLWSLYESVMATHRRNHRTGQRGFTSSYVTEMRENEWNPLTENDKPLSEVLDSACDGYIAEGHFRFHELNYEKQERLVKFKGLREVKVTLYRNGRRVGGKSIMYNPEKPRPAEKPVVIDYKASIKEVSEFKARFSEVVEQKKPNLVRHYELTLPKVKRYKRTPEEIEKRKQDIYEQKRQKSIEELRLKQRKKNEIDNIDSRIAKLEAKLAKLLENKK